MKSEESKEEGVHYQPINFDRWNLSQRRAYFSNPSSFARRHPDLVLVKPLKTDDLSTWKLGDSYYRVYRTEILRPDGTELVIFLEIRYENVGRGFVNRLRGSVSVNVPDERMRLKLILDPSSTGKADEYVRLAEETEKNPNEIVLWLVPSFAVGVEHRLLSYLKRRMESLVPTYRTHTPTEMVQQFLKSFFPPLLQHYIAEHRDKFQTVLHEVHRRYPGSEEIVKRAIALAEQV